MGKGRFQSRKIKPRGVVADGLRAEGAEVARRPKFEQEAGMQDAEGGVVGAGDDDDLTISGLHKVFPQAKKHPTNVLPLEQCAM